MRIINALRTEGIYRFRQFDQNMLSIPLWCENSAGKLLRRKANAYYRAKAKRDHIYAASDEWLQKLYQTWLYKPWLGHWDYESINANLVTDDGFALVASRINGADAEAAVTFLEVGSGTTDPAAGDTLLETPILNATDSGMDRQAATATRQTTTATDDTARLDTTFGPSVGSGHPRAITEAGAFNIATENTVEMLGRTEFTVKNIDSGGSLQVTYDFPVS